MAGVVLVRNQSRPIQGGRHGGDVYFNPGMSGLGTVGTIRSGRPTEYSDIPQGIGGSAGASESIRQGFGWGGRTNNLIDMAIDRKQQLFNEYNNLASDLENYHPRSPEAQSIRAQLRGIQMGIRDDNVEKAFRARQAQNDLMNAHREATLNQHNSEIEESASAMNRLIHADQLFRSGQISKEDHDQILLETPLRFPNATRANDYLRFLAERNDRMGDYKQRLTDREAGILSRRYGVPVEVDEDGNPSLELTHQSAMRSPKGQTEQLGVLNKGLTQRFGINTGVASLFNPVQPHVGGELDKEGNFVQSENQTHIQLPFLNHKGATEYATVPMNVFNAAKQEFEPDYRAIVGTPQVEATAPTVTQNNQFQAGKTYTDASGNRATYNQDGTWTEIPK